MKVWTVPSSFHQSKLIDFLSFSLGNKYSKKNLKRFLEKGCCKINGKTERFASKKVHAKEQIECSLLEEKELPPMHLLYEDENILVINKPIGIASEIKEFNSLFNQKFFLVHRLDKTTSGVLILAKSQHMFEYLKNLFKDEKIKKQYLAIVDRNFQEESCEVESYLVKKKFFQGQTIWGSNYENTGRYAKTKIEKIEGNEEFSILFCYPITGKTHQIRVHLKELNYPILGDFQYFRKFRCTRTVDRVMLHCLSVEFFYPPLEKILVLKTPFPKDFEEFLEGTECKF